MYLSRLIIHNYRSIKYLDLAFAKGKNVIVGKNNAGKSNIIKAIDLVLGASSPDWEKSDNITETDFFKTSSEILIYCELTRESGELLNFDGLYKCYGFYRDNICHDINPANKDELLRCFEISPDDGTRRPYINPKLRNQRSFENELDDKHIFSLIFHAHKGSDKKVRKELRLLYRQNTTAPWYLAFKAAIRSELLQSAIIPSFRDPQNQLRISNWTWYGKLLKTYLSDKHNEKLIKAFNKVKKVSNSLFRQLHESIGDSKIRVAFPGTKISFQFNPDCKQDIHKNAIIYVDDGFNSLLETKGAGIQSAVIIGLFDYYTRKIVHTGSSLLAIEEPELYLHPHGRRMLSARLDDFLDNGKNQVIATTHATEFLNSAHENLNIIVVRKTDSNGSAARNITINSLKEKQILLKSQNIEMFFADFVVLVEGNGDKYIFEAISREYGSRKKKLGESWLDENNVSVIAVGGKTEFLKYAQKLNELDIKYVVVADFDFFIDGIQQYLTAISRTDLKDKLNACLSLISPVSSSLPENIDNRLDAFFDGIAEPRIKRQKLEKAIKSYLGLAVTYKQLSLLNRSSVRECAALIKELESVGIFILTGELENFYKKSTSDIQASGKEERALAIVAQAIDKDEPISRYVKTREYVKILKYLNTNLKVKKKSIDVFSEPFAVEIDTTAATDNLDDVPF